MPHQPYPTGGESATARTPLPETSSSPDEEPSGNPSSKGEVPRAARRVDSVEVAKTLRRLLKRRFPTQRFYVRTDRYAGGAS